MKADLSKYGPTLRAREYCEAMSISEGTLRRQMKAGRCDVPPRMIAPYRWLREDLQQHLDTVDIAIDRRVKSAAKRRGLMRAVAHV